MSCSVKMGPAVPTLHIYHRLEGQVLKPGASVSSLSNGSSGLPFTGKGALAEVPPRLL